LAGKLEKYRRLGVLELVRFTVDRAPLLRVYDHVSGDLVERELASDHRAPTRVLGAFWIVVDDPERGPMLRLAGDGSGKELLATPEEAAALARERVRELEQELRRRG